MIHDFLFIFCLQGPPAPVTQAPPGTCQPITVPICEDVSYTNTILPNILGHKSQQEAGLAINQFLPLIKVECSPHLKPFLCSVYTPKCVLGRPQAPCRTLCEKARSGCGRLMSSFGLPWPESLKCEAFTTESCEEVRFPFHCHYDLKTSLDWKICYYGNDFINGKFIPLLPLNLQKSIAYNEVIKIILMLTYFFIFPDFCCSWNMSDHDFSFLQRHVLYRSISAQYACPQNSGRGKSGARSLYASCAA